MKRYNRIYLLTAVAVAIAIALYYKYSVREGFSGRGRGHLAQRDRSPVELYTTELTDIGSPFNRRYYNTNNEQLMYKELVRLFESISQPEEKRQTLRDTGTEFYSKDTLEESTRDELAQLTNILCDFIRNRTGEKYNFAVTTYDNCEIRTDVGTGHKHYVYETSVQDARNGFGIRLKIDIVKYVQNNNAAIKEAIVQDDKLLSGLFETYNDFDYYPIGPGNPAKRSNLDNPINVKMIANPRDVIVSGPDILNPFIVNLPHLPPIYAVFLNYVRIYNVDDHVLQGDVVANPARLPGVADIRLDSGTLNYGVVDMAENGVMVGDNGGRLVTSSFLSFPKIIRDVLEAPFVFASEVRNKWIHPPDEVGNPGEQPCSPQDIRWDHHGVIVSGGERCGEGMRDERRQQPFTAEFNPTIHTLPRHTGENAWIFDLSRGNMKTKAR